MSHADTEGNSVYIYAYNAIGGYGGGTAVVIAPDRESADEQLSTCGDAERWELMRCVGLDVLADMEPKIIRHQYYAE